VIVRQLVAKGHPDGPTMAAEMAGAMQTMQFDRLDVAVAYATEAGLEALRAAVGDWPNVTRWVVGLDDSITQPAAIDTLADLPNAEVRLASLASEGRRFHPKLYCLWSTADPAMCLAVIGSANMTLHGLNRNGEVGALLIAENVAEVDMLKGAWTQMSELGRDLAEWDLDAYRERHAKARKARRRLANVGIVAPDPEADEELGPTPMFNGDPAQATVAWTEGASPSAGGRDLEFPRAMMPFFGLIRSPTTKRFRMANGQVFRLTFTMRTDNQMWRLLFSRDAVLAGIGRESLRPVAGNTNRSDLAIVFTRAGGQRDYDVELVVIGSPQHTALLARTQAVGVLDRTRDPGGRFFGYY
jgi:hypothetical protein